MWRKFTHFTIGQLSALNAKVVSVPANINTTYISGASVTPAQHNNINDLVSFSFGTLNNIHDAVTQGPSDKIVVSITALVVDTPANQQSTTLTTTAVFSFNNGASTVSLDPVPVSVFIVLPQLGATQTCAPVLNGESGDVISCNVSITHLAAIVCPSFLLIHLAFIVTHSLSFVGFLQCIVRQRVRGEDLRVDTNDCDHNERIYPRGQLSYGYHILHPHRCHPFQRFVHHLLPRTPHRQRNQQFQRNNNHYPHLPLRARSSSTLTISHCVH